jgi:hypothetical protein
MKDTRKLLLLIGFWLLTLWPQTSTATALDIMNSIEDQALITRAFAGSEGLLSNAARTAPHLGQGGYQSSVASLGAEAMPFSDTTSSWPTAFLFVVVTLGASALFVWRRSTHAQSRTDSVLPMTAHAVNTGAEASTRSRFASQNPILPVKLTAHS